MGRQRDGEPGPNFQRGIALLAKYTLLAEGARGSLSKVAIGRFGLAAKQTGVFLVEDHKIVHASFLLQDNRRKISTRAFLLFLEQPGVIESAADVERRAIPVGGYSLQIHFPPE